jgi:putative FmdB family regulatory protein
MHRCAWLGAIPILRKAMPIYEYRCDNGHTFEVMQRMTDDPVASCQTCEAPVRRVFHPVAVHFKGSGFYNTDYGKAKRGAGAGDSSSDTMSSDGKGPSTDKKSESKSDAKSSSTSSGD